MPNVEWVAESRIVFSARGRLLGAALVAGSGGAATLSLYRGSGNTAPLLLTIAAPADDTKAIYLDGGVPIDGDLYAELSGSPRGALVIWEPAS